MDSDGQLVDRLRAGEEAAFVELVGRYQPQLLRLAEATVGSRAVAQEVTQDTWLAVVRGVDRFEGRSSFKTWLFRILLNRARSAATKEQKAGRPDDGTDERFDTNGAWADPPTPWADRVDDQMVANDLAQRVKELLPELPEAQRQVVVLRDVDGLSSTDVQDLLGISEGNQRVLLHRGSRQTPRPARRRGGPGMRIRFWRRSPLVCREAVALMTDYLEDRLDVRDRARFEAHLAGCPHCSEYLAQMRVTIDALGHVAPDDLSDDALDDLVDLYRAWRTDN